MANVWMVSERLNEGILSDTGLGKLGIAPVCVEPGGVTSSHSHVGVEEINIIKAGTGTLQIENDVMDVCPGTVAVIKSGEFHEIVNTGDENLEFIAIFNSDVDPKAVRLKNREEHFADISGPSYAGLLGKIAVGEARGAGAFKCWAQMTDNPEFAKTLNVIAIREAEHAHAFEKRLCELGCSVEDTVDMAFEKQMQVYETDASDIEKLKAFGADKDVFDDPFDRVFTDKTIDAQTGALLGRFVAEERDSIRMLQACYKALNAQTSPSVQAAAETEIGLREVCEAVTALAAVVSELQSDVRGLSELPKAPPPKAKTAKRKPNGSARAK